MSQGYFCFPYKLWEESTLVKGHKPYSPSPPLLQRDRLLLPLPPSPHSLAQDNYHSPGLPPRALCQLSHFTLPSLRAVLGSL